MKKAIIFILSALILFGAGTFAGAQSESWQTKLSVDAANDINQAGKDKTDELTTNLQDSIGTAVMTKVSPIIDAKKQALQDAIQAYFDSKVSTITDSQQYKDAVADLDRIETNELADYKAKIDQAFAGQ